jgi:hypothetical protein
MKLSQHGGFDPALEASMRDELLAEFTEAQDWAERVKEQSREVASYMEATGLGNDDLTDGFDFAACQLPGGRVYGIAPGKKCRKGTPISISPNEGMPAIAKKAKERGLKQADVKSVADAVREKYGLKQVKKGSALESAVRRLNERLQPGGEKPKDRPLQELGTRSLQDVQLQPGTRGLKARQEMVRRALGEAPKPATKPKKGEGTEAVDAKIREMQQGLKNVRGLKKANAGNPDAVRLYGAVEKELQKEIKRLQKAGPETKAKAAAARKPVGLDSGKGVVVNKKLLGQKTEVLQQILRERSLNPAQRKKIEEELGGRGVTPTAQKQVKAKVAAPRVAARRAQFDIPEGRKGYDVRDAYSQPGKVLGAGAMGEAKLIKGPPPAVVKKGEIGQYEAAVIKRLEGTGVTPKLYGAEITGPEKATRSGLGGHVKNANGFLAMSPMDGAPLMKSFYTMSAKDRAVMFDEYIRVRKEVHTRGVAHNDMHAGNFFYDPKTKKSGLVDFGLSQISPKAALVEAMGLGGRSQGDWQAARIVSGVREEGPRFKKFKENHAAVEKELKDKYGIRRLPEIRSKPEKLEKMLEGLSDRNAELLIKRLYDGV